MDLSVALVSVALLGSLGLHFVGGLAMGWALLIFFVGWPIGGTLITLDDDLKGGWSNPDGSARPPWLHSPFWCQIAGGLAVSGLGFAADVGWRSARGVPFWLSTAAATFLAIALGSRRWWFLVGVPVAIGGIGLWLRCAG